MTYMHLGIQADSPNAPVDLEALLTGLSDDIHAGNVTAGWWSNKDTGENILATRNRGELMMLSVSELSEASIGFLGGLIDDKLPEFPMFDVELGDTAIRLLDMIGAERSLGYEVAFYGARTLIEDSYRELRGLSADASLMRIVNRISAAMEHHRKGRVLLYAAGLERALFAVIALAMIHRIELFDVIAAKREFNSVRPDHKPEARRAAGGKAY